MVFFERETKAIMSALIDYLKENVKGLVPIILVASGGYYISISIFTLGMSSWQKQFTEALSYPRASADMMDGIYNMSDDYMPYLIPLGFCFLVLGLFVKRMGKSAIPVQLILTIAIGIWCVFYSIGTTDVFSSFGSEYGRMPDFFQAWINGVGIMGAIMTFGMFVVPHLIVLYKLINGDKEELKEAL